MMIVILLTVAFYLLYAEFYYAECHTECCDVISQQHNSPQTSIDHHFYPRLKFADLKPRRLTATVPSQSAL